jgi:hypothetical protein
MAPNRAPAMKQIQTLCAGHDLRLKEPLVPKGRKIAWQQAFAAARETVEAHTYFVQNRCRLYYVRNRCHRR